ncbi:MAG: hypothetical protein Q8R15_01565 [Candidatus Micrarchaeota archaeon]|nr:hypothetical protein [Candidatus Micrarchaeota archaeon]
MAKKPKKKIVRKLLAVPAAIHAAKKRKCIDIAIPANKLWECKVGTHKVAFIKGRRNLPLGIIAKKKKRGQHEVLLTVRPFDSSEHEHVISHVCAL